MKCEICKKSDASFYRYVATVGRKVPICTACFQKTSFLSQGPVFADASPLGLVEDLTTALMNFQPITEFYESETAKGRGVVCPNCGFEFADYYKKGRLGCVNCYDVFSEQITPVVYNLHGCARHNGSRPR
jgi:protein arginine kinase activator